MQYNILKTAIRNAIKENGNNEITGDILQNALITIINAFGAGMQFMGFADSDTTPGTPDSQQFYIAMEEGEYNRFIPDYYVDAGEIVMFTYMSAGWEATILRQANYFLSIDSTEHDGTLSDPYVIPEQEYDDAFDAFQFGRGVVINFADTGRNIYSTPICFGNDYIICTIIDIDDNLNNVYIFKNNG